MIHYAGGVEVPQWMVSDGTLRLLALTLLAYLPGVQGVYLVEEPEVGVHPTAIETIIQSLSSVYEGQVLVTSHSYPSGEPMCGSSGSSDRGAEFG
jgi:predicted ATPase